MEQKANIADYGFNILQIETISSCNMNCKFCPYPIRKDKNSILGEEYIYILINSLQNDERIEYVCLSHFNEPLLDTRIFDIINYVRQKGFPVMIITNALLFNNEQVVRSLLDSEPDFIKISLQSLDGTQFNSVRGINYSFSDYKRGIYEFLALAKNRRSKVYIDIGFNFLSSRAKIISMLLGTELGDSSVTDIAGRLRPKVKTFLLELKNFDPEFRFNDKMVDQYIDRMGKSYLQQEGLYVSEKIAIKFKKFIHGRRQKDFLPILGGVKCKNRILSVLATGSVVPCCLVYDDVLNMGNIKKEHLKDIMEKNRSFLNNLRKGIHLSKICKKCLGAPTRRGVIFRKIKDMLE